MASPLFRTKPLSLLLSEMAGENRLRRILGPTQLTALGVGAIIGTGIFILTGIPVYFIWRRVGVPMPEQASIPESVAEAEGEY